MSFIQLRKRSRERHTERDRTWLPRVVVLAASLLAPTSVLAVEAERVPASAPSVTSATGPVVAQSVAAATAPASASTTNPVDAAALLPWANNLQDGIDDAQRRARPILVEVGAEWCGWCRKLEAEIAMPAVQTKLATWTRVRLDADKDGETVRMLAVGPIPALRVLSPMGRVVATHDGYFPADELITWLETNRLVAAAAADVIGGDPADPAAAAALVPLLVEDSAVVREAATRRLLARPDVSAGAVVGAFAGGKLAQRLATLELLVAWGAPLDQLDPWTPVSITPMRIESLKDWAAQRAKAPPATRAVGAALSGDALAAARRDLAMLLQAPGAVEARAARERLARVGEAFLPEVRDALKVATVDRDRARLASLRYRLVASDALALAWPDGFDRLASADPQARQGALEDLTVKATAQDAPLLLEMFADADPLVREGSLRLLQKVGGEGMTAGLVKLLHDPEPNVRAAVLKQLAAAPVPGMEAEVIALAGAEPDADLVVHAVRVLRESKSRAAGDGLLSLLSHPSWRVRAEAAEALGKKVERNAQASERAADIYAAMIRLLEDPDGFVVSRAVLVLRDARLPAAIKPMIKAADRRPELAADVVKALSGKNDVAGAEEHLRRFCAHADAGVRAAAIGGLASVAGVRAGDDLAKALADAAPKVRTAAAEATLAVLETQRPGEEETTGGLFGFGGGGKRRRDMEAWLTEFRSGGRRPDWADPLAGPLEKLLDASEEERLAALAPLVALARDARAIPLLRDAANGSAAGRTAAVRSLPWLPREQRLAFYNELATRSTNEEMPALVQAMTVLSSPSTADALWATLGRAGADAGLAASVQQGLMKTYVGERYYGGSASAPEKVKPLVDAAKQRVESGPDMQRLVALALLVPAAPQDALAAAEKLVQDRPANDQLRADAFQVVLLTKPAPEGEAAAVAALGGAGGEDWEMKKLAVKYLAMGPGQLNQLRKSLYVSVSVASFDYGANTAIVIEPPKGLTPDMLRPMLVDRDAANAACAGYLMCLLGERAGLEPLVAFYRDQARQNNEWQRLVYRAVSVLGDDALVPILDEVYKDMGDQGTFYAKELYWTIRSMKGPNALKLRKQIRDTVGMDQLR